MLRCRCDRLRLPFRYVHPQPMGAACWPHVQAPCSRPCFRARGRRPSSPLVARARVYDAYPRNPPAFPPRFRVAAHSYDRAQSWWSRLFGGTPRHLLSSLTVPVRRPQTSAIVVPTAIAAVNALIAHVCDAALTPSVESEQYEEPPHQYSSVHAMYAAPLCEERACFYERR